MPKRILFYFLCLWLISLATAVAQNYDLDFLVPSPDGSSAVDTKDIVMHGREVKNVLYHSNKSLIDIGRFYEDFFAARGFEKTMDNAATSGKHLFKFQKQDLAVGLVFSSQGNQNQIVVTKYLQPPGAVGVEEETKLSVGDTFLATPKEDVPGEDLEFVPRPPDSIRWARTEAQGRINLVYGTRNSIESLVSFYGQRMSYYGWTLTKEQGMAPTVSAYENIQGVPPLPQLPIEGAEDLKGVIRDMHLLDFSGQKGKVSISIMPNFLDRRNGSVVQIDYLQNG